MMHAAALCLSLSGSPNDNLTFCDAKDGTLCARPLAKGDVAPFPGELMTIPLALKLKQDSNDAKKQCELAVQAAKADADIEKDRVDALRDAESKAHRDVMLKCVDTVEKQSKALEDAKPPWYSQPWFVAPLTAVVTAGVMGYVLTR